MSFSRVGCCKKGGVEIPPSLPPLFEVSLPQIPQSGFFATQNGTLTENFSSVEIAPKLLANGVYVVEAQFVLTATSFAAPHTDKQITAEIDFQSFINGAWSSNVLYSITSVPVSSQSGSLTLNLIAPIPSDGAQFQFKVSLQLVTASTNAYVWCTLTSSLISKIG